MMGKKKKKGISPLIATVIIIGFTIVLAALVIQFGTGFMKRTTEGAEKTGAIKQKCSIGIGNLDVRATMTAGNIKLLLDNKNDVKLFGENIRLYDSTDKNNIATIKKTEVVDPYGIKPIDLTPADYASLGDGKFPNKVGVLVQVKINEDDAAEAPATCENEFTAGISGAQAPAAPAEPPAEP